ncbi:NUDIX hydrolase [Desulfurispira natronophila]|uniref:Mutator protein MutT n=1 Tax=Desulfurispira natronophila TaxID=682562 RepID=A0A7W7Y2S2_9BACT|nr:CoA pyrophosphatase [Desulfurispira natronophila]MBB5020742.1 mutator protein MutT [Desulfurispira natronophila]
MKPQTYDAHLSVASVVLPLVVDAGEIQILLMRRAEDDYHHSRQISFPGGRLDPGEDPRQCACREFQEELGVPIKDSDLLGLVDIGFAHVSNSIINCYVGCLQGPIPFQPDPQEVEYLIPVPLNFFFGPANVGLDYFEHGNFRYVSPVFMYNEERIWGATARMLATFLTQMNNALEEHHV